MLASFSPLPLPALAIADIGGQSLVYHPGLGFTLMTILTLTTGSAFIMWLGEQISERGIGNGMSLIIFVGIVVGLPRAIFDLYEKAKTQAWGAFTPLGDHPSRCLDDRRCGLHRLRGRCATPHPGAVRQARGWPPHDGRTVHLLASACEFRWRDSADFCQFVARVSRNGSFGFGGRWPFLKHISDTLRWGEPLYTVVYITMIILFAFFYVGIVFNPTEVADNMRKNGGFVPGIRPGRSTSEYISGILKRLTFIGAIYLAAGLFASGMDDCGYSPESLARLAGWRLV